MLGGLAENERLIPAHAGKTWPRRRRVLMRRAHPRSRGENHSPSYRGVKLSGSSPLTRGKLQAIIPIIASVRLIPAHAGKTRPCNYLDCAAQAHPRSRGENPWKASLACCLGGSSPLTRGKRFELQESREDTGLIPAHAGKTQPYREPSAAPSAHPRSRGENITRRSCLDACSGSSPLTRGKRRPRSR